MSIIDDFLKEHNDPKVDLKVANEALEILVDENDNMRELLREVNKIAIRKHNGTTLYVMYEQGSNLNIIKAITDDYNNEE